MDIRTVVTNVPERCLQYFPGMHVTEELYEVKYFLESLKNDDVADKLYVIYNVDKIEYNEVRKMRRALPKLRQFRRKIIFVFYDSVDIPKWLHHFASLIYFDHRV